MSKDSQSAAASEASTLVGNNGEEDKYQGRTTITGKPIKYDHDNLSNMMLGDGGGAFPSVGANHLPYGYTDKSLTRIPIKMSDVEDPSEGSDIHDPSEKKKRGFLSKFSSHRKKDNDEIKVVMMSRGDYLKYWAKGNDGKFLDSVVEPPEGRKEWLRKQLELNEEMVRNDPSLGKEKVSYTPLELVERGVAGMGGAGA